MVRTPPPGLVAYGVWAPGVSSTLARFIVSKRAKHRPREVQNELFYFPLQKTMKFSTRTKAFSERD